MLKKGSFYLILSSLLLVGFLLSCSKKPGGGEIVIPCSGPQTQITGTKAVNAQDSTKMALVSPEEARDEEGWTDYHCSSTLLPYWNEFKDSVVKKG